MQSVLSQTHTNLEYIIVDGCSKDATHEIIRSFIDTRIRLVIEEDDGIYDAMNKGFSLATGDIIYFLNCGDYLANERILEDVCSCFLVNPDVDIIYGDVIRYGDQKEEYLNMKRETPLHLMTRCICHQGIFAKRTAFHNIRPFQTEYPVYADFEWILSEISLHKIKLKYMNQVVAYYLSGGVSDQDRAKNFIERFRCTRKYFGHVIEKSYVIQYPTECILFLIKYCGMLVLYGWHQFITKMRLRH